jgi:uncharacterized repeat protein (TIGR03847 family)
VPREFRHDSPDRCVVGTVGEPGARTFYLQARTGSWLTSVVLEKVQVAALGDRLEEMLDEIVRRSGGRADVPAVAPGAVEDLAPLDLPLEEEFRVGSLTLAWISEQERVEITLAARGESDEESADDRGTLGGDAVLGDTMVVRLTGVQARAFVSRARAVVAAGRPPCPFCAQPLDPSGHLCPRQNGFHRRS